MEILGNNLEIEMAQSHLFLSLADADMPMTEAEGLLAQVGGAFLEKYHSIIPERRTLIYQYGIHPEGRFIDLRDLERQCEKEWVAVLAIGVDFSKHLKEKRWTLNFAPSHYMGYVTYSTPISCEGVVTKDTYSAQGTQYEYVDSAPNAQEASAALQLLAMSLQFSETVARADVLLDVNNRFVNQLAQLTSEVCADSDVAKEREKEVAQLKGLINLVRFK